MNNALDIVGRQIYNNIINVGYYIALPTRPLTQRWLSDLVGSAILPAGCMGEGEYRFAGRDGTYALLPW